jgi:hypothetical protein
VAIGADQDTNNAILENALKAIAPGGHGLIVLPSIESAHLSALQLQRWYQKEGTASDAIHRGEFIEFTAKHALPHAGILMRAGVRTKHYLKEELELFFNRRYIQIESLSKVEYNWNTEFNAPPKWMKSPYPWDWLVHCRRS